MADCKQLIKTLIVAVRTVVWSVSNVKTVAPPQPGAAGVPQTFARGMQEHECAITAKLLKHGLKCFSIYAAEDTGTAGGAGAAGHAAPSKEEKEILDLFAGVFVVLDERTFRDVLTLHMQVQPVG